MLCARIDFRQSPEAFFGKGGDNFIGRNEAVRRHAKTPLRRAELSFHLNHAFDCISRKSINIPPARLV